MTLTALAERLIIDYAYQWRSADIHVAACRLGVHKDVWAEQVLEEKLATLRTTLDMFKK